MKKLIALTLALLLAGLLLPTTALAEENNNVAKIGDTKYASFKDALGVANDGDTITLLKDCELSEGDKTIRVEKTGVTLDLNGFTMTLGSYLDVVGGNTFTIQNGKSTGGITIAEYGVFTTSSQTTINLTGVTITGTNKKELLFEAWSKSTYHIKNCNITWQDTCIRFIGTKDINFTIENTTMNLTGSKDAIAMRSEGGRLEIINSTITGEAAKLFVTPDTNNPVDRPSVSVANDAPQSGIMEYSYDAYKSKYNSGKFILPGVSDASAKLKAMLKESFTSDALLVSGPDGLYIEQSAIDMLKNLRGGEAYSVDQGGLTVNDVPEREDTINNNTTNDITINDNVIKPGGYIYFSESGPVVYNPTPELDPPSTIVIIRPAEEKATQPNPATGAPQVIAVAAAVSAIAAVLAAVLLLRREEE
ncbi:MAG: hypothetical protein KH194_04760 [Clostridiales bacterium]|nr:hypothetical protein [Clostridiales bacterium]